MIDWSRAVASELRAHVGDQARPLVQKSLGRMFERRYDVLAAAHPHLSAQAPRAVGLVMGGLYRAYLAPKAAWMFEGAGGPARTPLSHLRAARLLAPLSAR